MKIHSIIRDGEYKELGAVTLNGSILDLGGNRDSEYHKLIKGEHAFTSVNINPRYGCDMVFDIEEPFPIGDEKFDAVISMNVLEHIYRFENAISETYRVLKKGGRFVFTVPFMHHIHGSPDDYFRYTRSAIEKMLKENGFEDILIKEIGLGIFSLIYQSSAGAFPQPFKRIAKNAAILLDRFFLKFFERYRAASKRIPLGYFITAKKANN